MPSRWISALALIAAAPSATAQDFDGTQWAQLSIHERIIIRIPRMAVAAPATRAPVAPTPTARWSEKKGQKCLPTDDIAGAALYAPGAVDFVLRGGKRFRARLGDECPTLDYYFGFYLKPTADRKVCADRDAIRSRSGAVCPIHEFRRLIPQR